MRALTRGFTLIEMLVVMVVIALLLTIAVPRYFDSVERARETVLRENLLLMRDALDKHYGDFGHYPNALDELVSKRYLRFVPVDPITERRDSWQIVEPPADAPGLVFDVRSGAEGVALSGEPYAQW